MTRLRAAVVGSGWIGSAVADDPLAQGIQSHAGAYAACASTELVAVCDVDLVRAERAAARWGLPGSISNVAEMLRVTKPQIVSICTPDDTHADTLRQILQGPDVCAVIVEKPLALDLDEARSLVDEADRLGVILAVNYSRRFAPSHIEARRRVKAGEIGTVLSVQGAYTKGVMHNGTHWFDLARWFIGEIRQVQAWPGPTAADDADPTCHVRMTFAGGQAGFLLGLNEDSFTLFEMDIIGTEGRLKLANSGMLLQWYKVAESPYYSGYRILRPASEGPAGFKDVARHLVEDVVSAVRGGAVPQCTGQDAVSALAVASAARRSLAMGVPCTVE